jgi:predicted peptidase
MVMTARRFLLKVMSLVLFLHATSQAALATDFLDYSLFDSPGGSIILPGRFYTPPEALTGPRPLILFLHGGGERGSDNTLQINGNIDNLLAEAKRRGAYLYAPQTTTNWANRAITDRVQP